MKKTMFAFACITAALVSCTKEKPVEPELNVTENGQIVLTAGFDLDNEDETKVHISDSIKSSKVNVYWDNGDQFALYMVTPEKEADFEKKITSGFSTYCGPFTSFDVADWSTKAKFIGTIPSDAVSTSNGFAIYPASSINDSYRKNDALFTSSKSTQEYKVLCTGVTCTIPNVQDGTGNKYLIFASRFESGVLSNFSSMTQMFKVNLQEFDAVTEIKFTIKPKTTSLGLCGNNWNLYYNSGTGAWIQSSASTKELTITKDGEILKGDVYAVTRTVNSGDTLYFKFTYNNGSTKTYRKAFSSGTKLGYIYDLGTYNLLGKTVTFNSSTSSITHNSDPSKVFPRCKKIENVDTYYGLDGTTTYSTYTALSAGVDETIDWNIEGQVFTFVRGNSCYFISDPTKADPIQLPKLCYIKLPKITGYRLYSVYIDVANGAGNTKKVGIYDGDTIISGEQQSVNENSPVTLYPDNTVSTKQYILKDTKGNIQYRIIKLIYRPE